MSGQWMRPVSDVRSMNETRPVNDFKSMNDTRPVNDVRSMNTLSCIINDMLIYECSFCHWRCWRQTVSYKYIQWNMPLSDTLGINFVCL
jgi:hypothetical protein